MVNIATVQYSLVPSPSSPFQRDIRDIFTPIHFELQYELGKHNVVRGNSESFPSLRPMLQRGGKYSNLLTNKVG